MQERWKETSGLSPSTLAIVIAALICSADAGRFLKCDEDAAFVEAYADWIERNLARWTATKQSTLVLGVTSHYVRIAPLKPGEAPPADGITEGSLELTSRAPGAQSRFLARDIVNGGFLELVRYGIRAADDPLIVDTVKVCDALLKAETPSGPAWRRYNNDGYGQRDGGAPYEGWGKGRAWPLLAGERGHYEIAAGRSAAEYIRAIENFAAPTGLIPEQSWDDADTADGKMKHGRPHRLGRPSCLVSRRIHQTSAF